MSHPITIEYLDEIQPGFAQHGVDANHTALLLLSVDQKKNPRVERSVFRSNEIRTSYEKSCLDLDRCRSVAIFCLG